MLVSCSGGGGASLGLLAVVLLLQAHDLELALSLLLAGAGRGSWSRWLWSLDGQLLENWLHPEPLAWQQFHALARLWSLLDQLHLLLERLLWAQWLDALGGEVGDLDLWLKRQLNQLLLTTLTANDLDLLWLRL